EGASSMTMATGGDDFRIVGDSEEGRDSYEAGDSAQAVEGENDKPAIPSDSDGDDDHGDGRDDEKGQDQKDVPVGDDDSGENEQPGADEVPTAPELMGSVCLGDTELV
ncbi:MAG: hypothetical protein Q4B54_14225, partial [Coriobacteriales bacterium]|nr:hypothetical protein [Coriobacteriales bacterium]